MQHNLKNKYINIDIQQLDNGVYIVKAIMPDNILSKKFVLAK